MSLKIENEIAPAVEQAIRAEREVFFKLICASCAEGNTPKRLREFAWWHWPEDSQRRKQCQAARLREWMHLPNHPSQLLAAQISHISERIFQQTWMNDIEFNLWTVLKEMNPVTLSGLKRYYGFEDITDAELAGLNNLAEQADGWVYWDIYDRSFKFASFPEWKKIHAAQLDRYNIPERFEQIIQAIPKEELEQLPSDSSEQHDHYIYGANRRD